MADGSNNKVTPELKRVRVLNNAKVAEMTGYGKSFQWVDEATATEFYDGSVLVVGCLTVDGEHQCVKDHWGIMPGSLVLEHAAQVAYIGALLKKLVKQGRIRPVRYTCDLNVEALPGDRLITVCSIGGDVRTRRTKSKNRKGEEITTYIFTQSVQIDVYKANGSWGGERELIMSLTVKAVALP